ncbi:DNA-3-methyladenine glycosylase [Marinobacter nanhaiticus D15-8W]|uniref:DNA-3-methyladenine glycosylase II n=1 Tax=Marinobacter nanhaiticus D15-8W TaxID=626887 RepID=N6WVF7_9GAMM|nr:AlkA N-terminal domain-containing protein [Marinobacter nanhaiticus]ENO15571.1 DNA-3-methyladenine glycosylase 2 [Marinobacter nanhaiticus D15-8W]BES73579.1 DNA-3-methyladenine glycosylase [Marinobacter nanhaiticus D15-8W]
MPKPDPNALICSIPLPANFRADDVLAFHQRDTEQIAEQVTESQLHKGILWDGKPARLSIEFHANKAIAFLAEDGGTRSAQSSELEQMVRRMLGLTQPVELFEQTLRDHPQLGPVIARNAGLRVPQTATPFEALCWAIIGQQISVGAAVSIRRRFIQAVGRQHSSGLWCFPDASAVVDVDLEILRATGLSRTKAGTILAISEQIEQRSLPLDSWLHDTPAETIEEQLRQVRGIGPWTISYALLRGFGWMDGSLHGDVAVRRNLQSLLGREEKLTEKEARIWLEGFSPWRALVAAHLWALQSAGGY